MVFIRNLSIGTAVLSLAASASARPKATTIAAAVDPSCSVAPSTAGKLKYAGVNIAGFDFGCNTDGSCTASAAWPPLTQYYGNDGLGQMQRFVKTNGFNVFRLPVGWQYLVNDKLGGAINEDNFVKFDALVQACLSTGADCVLE
jgi:endoglucanase